MLYFIKSVVRSIAKNGNSFYKLTLIPKEPIKDKSVIEATCFTAKDLELQFKVIESDLDAYSQYPKVLEGEAMACKPLFEMQEIPDLFQKYVPNVPTKEEFTGIVKELLQEAGKLESKLGKKIYEDSFELYESYSKATAAKLMHHAFFGGLALHTYEMLKLLYAFVRDGQKYLPFRVNILHCTIGVLFHDYGKLQEYSGMDYTESLALTPHNFVGAVEIEKRYASQMKRRTLQLIQHIILSHHGRLEWGATCTPATLEAFLVYHIDNLSGHGSAMANCVNMERCPAINSMVIVP